MSEYVFFSGFISLNYRSIYDWATLFYFSTSYKIPFSSKLSSNLNLIYSTDLDLDSTISAISSIGYVSCAINTSAKSYECVPIKAFINL